MQFSISKDIANLTHLSSKNPHLNLLEPLGKHVGVEGALQRCQLEAVLALTQTGQARLPLADGNFRGPLHAGLAELVPIAARHHLFGQDLKYELACTKKPLSYHAF